jgi:hypothetical protein
MGERVESGAMSRIQGPERAFRTAFRHLCEAATFDDAADQLSNMLHQLYRLSELGEALYGGAKAFYAELYKVNGGEVAGAVLWARNFDTHDVARLESVSKPGDVYSDYYTNLYGVLVWNERGELPPPDPKFPAHGRDLLYDHHLAGRSVLSATQTTLRALLDVLP